MAVRPPAHGRARRHLPDLPARAGLWVGDRPDPVKRVLPTGARGFLGSNCLAPLLARGYEVHAVSRAPSVGETRGPVETTETVAGVVWHQADLLDGQQVTALLDAVRPTHLLHLAWVVTPGAF